MDVKFFRIRSSSKALMLLFFLFSIPINSEIFTSYVQVKNMIETELAVLRYLHKNIKYERDRIDAFEKTVSTLEDEIRNATADPERYAGNPINQFLIIKHLTVDWNFFKDSIQNNEIERSLENLKAYYSFPDMDDYKGAIHGIFRLQDTYALSPQSLGEGVLSRDYKSRPLTAAEYFEIGRQAYEDEDFYHALSWLNASLHKLKEENTPTISESTVLDHLSFVTFKQGNLIHALNLTKELLNIDPSHERGNYNKALFEQILSDTMKQRMGERGVNYAVHIDDEVRNNRQDTSFYEKARYEELCRGENVMNDINRLSKLVCRYRTNNKPRLLLSPIKEEEIFDEPKIVLFHDVVTEKEIETLKKLAEPQLQRALIHNPVTSVLEPAQYRISKLCWMNESLHPTVAKLSVLMEDATNFSMQSAEMLQVQNYGVGGHYEPHFDFSRTSEPHIFTDGNRVATWLTYLTDVEYGGFTVFTPIGARVVPKKGSAVFWINMFRSGKGDYRTRHAACPVLFGTKWVANRWFHESGQEFIRPCTKDPME